MGVGTLATVNQRVQLGIESVFGQSPGTGSNRNLLSLTLMPDPDFQDTMYRPTGYQYDSTQVPTYESSKWKPGGPLSYTEFAYLASGLWGLPTFTIPTNGVTARQMAWAPVLTGPKGGISYQLQHGDSTRMRQVNGAQVTGFDLDIDRSKCDVSGGEILAQQLQNNAGSFTATPVAQSIWPVLPDEWNIYLDPTSANIGVTQLQSCFAAKMSYGGAYGPTWTLNRSNASYASVLDLAPKATYTLREMPDAQTDAWWTQARGALTGYMRWQAVGLPIDNQYNLALGAATAGTFTVTYKGITSGTIAYNATAAAVQTALQAAFGTSVTATGTTLPTGPVKITLGGSNANDPSPLTINTAGLTGYSGSLTNISVFQTLTIDAAVKYRPKSYADEKGAWTHDWEFSQTFDPAWTEGSASGTALYITCIANMTSL